MNDSIQTFIDKSLNRLLLPTMLSCVSIVVVSLTDAALVSYYIGAWGLAVVSLFIPLLTIWGCIYEGLGVGTSSLLAHHIGEGRQQTGAEIVEKANSMTLLLALVIAALGISFTYWFSAGRLGVSETFFEDALWYARMMMVTTIPLVFNNYLLFLLRTDSASGFAAFSTGIQVVLNLSLDIYFMGYLHTGVKGAAMALFIASSAALLSTIVYLQMAHSIVRLRFRWPEWSVVRKLGPYTLNALSDNMSDFVLSLFINIFVLVVFGIKIASIVYIMLYVKMFVIYYGMGLTYSVTPIVGVFYGEKNHQALNYIARRGMVYAALSGCVLALLVFTFAHEIAVYVFSFEYPDYDGICERALRVFSVSLPFYLINMMMICYCQQTERFRLSFGLCVANSLMMLLVIVCFTLIVKRADGMWWGAIIADLVTLGWWLSYSMWKKHRMHADSFLCLPDNPDQLKAEAGFVVNVFQPDGKEREMADFLAAQGLGKQTVDKALSCLSEIKNFTSDASCSCDGFLRIRLMVNGAYDVRIKVQMAQGPRQGKAMTERDRDSYGKLESYLQTIATEINYSRVLSFQTLDLQIKTEKTD